MPKESKQQVYKDYTAAPVDDKEKIQEIENDIWIG